MDTEPVLETRDPLTLDLLDVLPVLLDLSTRNAMGAHILDARDDVI